MPTPAMMTMLKSMTQDKSKILTLTERFSNMTVSPFYFANWETFSLVMDVKGTSTS